MDPEWNSHLRQLRGYSFHAVRNAHDQVPASYIPGEERNGFDMNIAKQAVAAALQYDGVPFLAGLVVDGTGGRFIAAELPRGSAEQHVVNPRQGRPAPRRYGDEVNMGRNEAEDEGRRFFAEVKLFR